MWQRVLVDNLKSMIPFKPALRKIYRRVRPYDSNPENDELSFQQGLSIVRQCVKRDASIDRVVELGTGWIPIIPNILQLCGAKQFIYTDVDRLMDHKTRNFAKELVMERVDEIESATRIDKRILLKNADADRKEEFRCPPDLHRLPAERFDLIYSRAVLEHVQPGDILNILVESRRILKPDGLGIHLIDNSDHFEHRDKTLSRVNFLKYSDLIWWFACINIQNYQNRLRHSDYIELIKQTHYEILHSSGEVDDKCVDDVRSMKLADRFLGYSAEDLSILQSEFVIKKRQAPADCTRIS